MATTKQVVGWGLGIIVLIAIIVGLTPNGWLRKLWSKMFPSGGNDGNGTTTRTVNENTYNENENKCVLRNNRGEEITITSESNNELFRRYCLQQGYTQPYYFNYVYYYPIRWWKNKKWNGHWDNDDNGNGNENGNGNGAPANGAPAT